MKEDSYNYDHRRMEKKYDIGPKTFMRLCQNLGFKWGKIEQFFARITKPEEYVLNILNKNNITYIREKYVNNGKFRLDFLLNNNKAIEVNGDFWHANPEMFDYSNLCNVQSKNVVRDIAKIKWLEENNYKLLIIWEKETKSKINNIEQIIIDYANNN